MSSFSYWSPFILTQYGMGPTHECGHTIDLVLSSGLCPDNMDYEDPVISDHKPIVFFVFF